MRTAILASQNKNKIKEIRAILGKYGLDVITRDDADALIVGNFLNAESLAAVTSTSSLVFLIIGFCVGFSSGAGVIVSRHLGARDDEQTGKAVHTAVLLGLVIGIITTILGVFFADDLLRLMGTPANIIARAALYLLVSGLVRCCGIWR